MGCAVAVCVGFGELGGGMVSKDDVLGRGKVVGIYLNGWRIYEGLSSKQYYPLGESSTYAKVKFNRNTALSVREYCTVRDKLYDSPFQNRVEQIVESMVMQQYVD